VGRGCRAYTSRAYIQQPTGSSWQALTVRQRSGEHASSMIHGLLPSSPDPDGGAPGAEMKDVLRLQVTLPP
jgi:hypothetical protein